MTISLPELCVLLFEDVEPTRPVLFRVDAGREPGLSFGHLSRCLLLSRTLRRQGRDTALLMRDLPEGVVYARNQGERVLPPTADTLRQHPARALLVDLPYDPDPELLTEARRQDLRHVYLDDTGRSHIDADVVLNTSILAHPAMYPQTRRALLGPDYFFLDPDDLAMVRRERAAPDPSYPPHVVMTFGGSDPTGLTIQALAALERCRLPIRLDVVLGPGFANIDEAQDVAARIAARVLVSPQRLLPLLQAADLVVCAGGRTLYECHALGVPVFVVASAPHEAKQILAFLERGLVMGGMVEWNEKIFTRAFASTLHMFRPKDMIKNEL